MYIFMPTTQTLLWSLSSIRQLCSTWLSGWVHQWHRIIVDDLQLTSTNTEAFCCTSVGQQYLLPNDPLFICCDVVMLTNYVHVVVIGLHWLRHTYTKNLQYDERLELFEFMFTWGEESACRFDWSLQDCSWSFSYCVWWFLWIWQVWTNKGSFFQVTKTAMSTGPATAFLLWKGYNFVE